MKICVLCLPRTSSHNTSIYLSSQLGIKNLIVEPFNKNIWTDNKISIFDEKIKKDKDIIVKIMLTEFDLPYNVENSNELLIWIKKTFTHVICLYRENIFLQSESFIYHITKQKKYQIDWHKPKIVNFNENDRDEVLKTINLFEKYTLKMKIFASDNNFPIIKYEDIIINEGDNDTLKNICNYLNVVFDKKIAYNLYKKENKVSNFKEDFKINKML